MNPDEIWKELDLGSLLINPQLITENHKKLDPFLKHEKKWRKPNYKALKSRYDVIPTKPKVYHKQYINRLADPIKGKYMKYHDIFDDNDSVNNNNKNEINSNNDYDNNDDGGFFITEDINTNTNHTKSNVNENKYKHAGSSIRKKFNEAITNANKLNNSIWKDKFKQINTNNKKTIINKKIKRKKVKAIQPYRIPIVLDNIRSSGYGYNIKINKNAISQPKWKIDRLEEFNKLKHSPNKLLKVNKKLRSQSISDVNVNGLANNNNNDNNNELEKDIDEGSSRIRHSNMPPLPTIHHKKNNKIVRSAPNLITRTNELKAIQVVDKQRSINPDNINKNKENSIDSKINKSKLVVSSSSVNIINVDSITTKSNNKKIVEQDLKYKSTEQLLEALQRIDSYDKAHNDEDIKLTNKLTKHIKNISSTLATAESHINSYKDITIEDIKGGLRLPLDLE